MSANFEDDEALFDDVYADESAAPKVEEKAPETSVETAPQPQIDYSQAFAQLQQSIGAQQGEQGQNAPQAATVTVPGLSGLAAAGASAPAAASATPVASAVPGLTQVAMPPAVPAAIPGMSATGAYGAADAATNPMAQMQQMFQQQMQQMQQQMQAPAAPAAPAAAPSTAPMAPMAPMASMAPMAAPPSEAPRVNLEGKDVGKMFIGGLNWETDESRLKEYFSSYGNVVEVNVMRDGATGKSRGFAFLTFDSGSSVDKVLSEKHILDGKLIDPKRAIPKDEQEKIGKVFVGGVASEVTTEEFRAHFEQFGNIIDSQLMINKDTGKSRGYGFVTYDSADAVERCTRDKYVMFHGKRMEVKKAEPRAAHNVKKMQDSGSGMMPGGDMTQYMQQMQQMQQMWMQQMQQMQMNPEQMQNMMMNPMMMPGMQQGMSQGMPQQSQSHAQYEDDDVPNPQAAAGTAANAGSSASAGAGGPAGSPSGMQPHHSQSPPEHSQPALPSGPRRFREKETTGFGNERRREGGGGGGRRRRDRRRTGGGGGGRGRGDRGDRGDGSGAGSGSGSFHPYRR